MRLMSWSVDPWLDSAGGISALTTLSTGFIKALLVLSITTVLYPIISKMAASENTEGLNAISEAMSIVNLLWFQQ